MTQPAIGDIILFYTNINENPLPAVVVGAAKSKHKYCSLVNVTIFTSSGSIYRDSVVLIPQDYIKNCSQEVAENWIDFCTFRPDKS